MLSNIFFVCNTDGMMQVIRGAQWYEADISIYRVRFANFSISHYWCILYKKYTKPWKINLSEKPYCPQIFYTLLWSVKCVRNTVKFRNSRFLTLSAYLTTSWLSRLYVRLLLSINSILLIFDLIHYVFCIWGHYGFIKYYLPVLHSLYRVQFYTLYRNLKKK